MNGDVIGINTAILGRNGSIGIGFSIPSNSAKIVIDQLIKFGETKRGWLGVRIQDVTKEIAEVEKLDKPRGALVASVAANSPSDKGEISASSKPTLQPIFFNANAKFVAKVDFPTPPFALEIAIVNFVPLMGFFSAFLPLIFFRIASLNSGFSFGIIRS